MVGWSPFLSVQVVGLWSEGLGQWPSSCHRSHPERQVCAQKPGALRGFWDMASKETMWQTPHVRDTLYLSVILDTHSFSWHPLSVN